ncbi:MAG: CRTAC1 family protein [Deltaproteobacteria bacterium]|nr:CRTAC1 family protein [Deltaproteobacteria bacterium]
MTVRGWRWVAMLLPVGALVGCPGGNGSPAADADTADVVDDDAEAPGEAGEADAVDGEDGGLPPPRCTAGTYWSTGTPIFREATAESGLEGIGALGIRISAVDFDGDGFADIAARQPGAAGDDFGAGGTRLTWLLRNRGDGTFEDVTVASGIRRTRAGADPDRGRPGDVFAFGDVDNDGFLDVFTGLQHDAANPTEETSEILLNNGDGTFRLGPETSELRRTAAQGDSVAGASFLDFDHDGCLDLWIVENALAGDPAQDQLYHGDCTGAFVRDTSARGLVTRAWSSVADLNAARSHSWGWSAAACDLNNDGWLDLLASSYGRAPNLLWRAGAADTDFRFTNESVASGYAFDERTDWSDNESARCWCHLHPTDTGCAGVPAPTRIACSSDADAFRWDNDYDREPFRLGGNSGATVCADMNNDGWLDLLTGEIVHWDVGLSSDPAELLVNLQDPAIRFERPGNDVTGLARDHARRDWNEGIMSGSALDFDNDGRLDLYWGDSDYPGAYGRLFHQDAAGHFESVGTAEGIDQHRSHGVAVADFDGDGAQDVVVGHSFARCADDPSRVSACYPTQQLRLFENVFGAGGNFVELRLAGGGGTNAAAIGARVTATAGGVTQTREVGGGYGHYGAQNDLAVHFGLGAECEAEMTVRWPDAAQTTQTFTLPAGWAFSLVQGGEPEVLGPTD